MSCCRVLAVIHKVCLNEYEAELPCFNTQERRHFLPHEDLMYKSEEFVELKISCT